MPGAVRLGDNCTGHGCFPSRPNNSASDNVSVNGRGLHRLNDSWAAHCCPDAGCHGGYTIQGSSTVSINGRPATRIGDMINCGSYCLEGSSDVSIGG